MTEEIKYSVTELAEILHSMPIHFRGLIAMIIAPPDTGAQRSIEKTLAILKIAKMVQDVDLIKALNSWNWNFPPHTDPIILVLIEELLEEYRE